MKVLVITYNLIHARDTFLSFFLFVLHSWSLMLYCSRITPTTVPCILTAVVFYLGIREINILLSVCSSVLNISDRHTISITCLFGGQLPQTTQDLSGFPLMNWLGDSLQADRIKKSMWTFLQSLFSYPISLTAETMFC